MSAKEILDSVDLDQLSDSELLDHLDRVSGCLKGRNSLFPKSGKAETAAEVLDTLRRAVEGSAGPRPRG